MSAGRIPPWKYDGAKFDSRLLSAIRENANARPGFITLRREREGEGEKETDGHREREREKGRARP